MRQLVENFPEQLQAAIAIGKKYQFIHPKKSFSNIMLTGLGGSGIGGSIVQNFSYDQLRIPFLVNKDYSLPGFVGEDTLVIVSSYSGNTEETVACLKQAVKAQAGIVCITTGGTVAEIAARHKLDCIMLPSGMPPRSCLGYSMVQVLYTLAWFGLIQPGFERELKASVKLLQAEKGDIQKQAKAIAKKITGTTPVLYAASAFEGVAVRFRQQINENSKMLAWHHVIPEMNHNELVGWAEKDPSKTVVFLRNATDYDRVQMRMELNKKVIKRYTPKVLEIWSKGKSYLEKAIYLVHLTDWVSIYLADLHNVDAMDIKVLNELKNALASRS